MMFIRIESKQMENAINEARTKYSGKGDRFTMSFKEFRELARIADEMPYEATAAAFNYGFAKGVRFAKAMMEKGEQF